MRQRTKDKITIVACIIVAIVLLGLLCASAHAGQIINQDAIIGAVAVDPRSGYEMARVVGVNADGQPILNRVPSYNDGKLYLVTIADWNKGRCGVCHARAKEPKPEA